MSTIDVKTEITGNVCEIVMATGDTVAEDDPILILESMKMEIPIIAPEAGKIVEILVEVGQIVKEGSILARIEV